MKIILDKRIVECNEEEGIRIIKELLSPDKGIKELKIPDVPLINLKPSGKHIGSGNYPHKSEVTEDKKDLIKKIFENSPERSLRTVAKELNLTEDQVWYWKDKLNKDVSRYL